MPNNEHKQTTLSQLTTNHFTIHQWAEERGAQPVAIESKESRGDEGSLGFSFEDEDDRTSAAREPISWEKFFERFDVRDLAFRYEEETRRDGRASHRFQFVKRH